MKLAKKLMGQGYDLITAPIRSHSPLQLWSDKPGNPFDSPDLFASSITNVLSSSTKLTLVESGALSVTSSDVESFNFNIGMTVLDDLLKALALGNMDLSLAIKTGSSVDISYDKSICFECPVGDIKQFLDSFDFVSPNHGSLLRDLNRNRILILSGVLFAENLLIKIKTTHEITAEVKAEIEKILNVNVKLSTEGSNTIVLKADDLGKVPVAVKAHRIRFRNNRFIDLRLITDGDNPLERSHF